MDLVRKVGGFDESIIFFEESVLPQKIEELGYGVYQRVKPEILHHEDNFSLGKWLKKKYYYARTARQCKAKYNNYTNKQTGFFYRFRLFLFKFRFYSHPIYAIGTIVLKLLEFMFAWVGFLKG